MPDSTVALRNAENNAISHSEPSYGNGSNNGGGFYTGNGRNKNSGRKKKKSPLGPIITIALIIISGGAFLSSSNSLLAGALEALYTEQTDTQYTSYSMRVPQIMEHMLRGGSATTVTWNGQKKYLHMSNSFKDRLAKFDIEVEGSGTSRVLKWNNETIDASQFIQKYHSDADFRDAYTKAKRGRVATFFDDIADKIYQKHSISRNFWNDYKQSNDSSADAENFRTTMSDGMNNKTSATLAAGKNVEEIEYDEDGNEIGKNRVPDYTSDDSINSNIDDPTSRANSFLTRLSSKAAEVTGVIDKACAALKIGNLISVTVSTIEIYQSINYFMKLMENVSKMKAGYGSESAINELLNMFSTSEVAEIPDLNILSVADAKDTTRTQQVVGPPLESKGMQNILANAPVDPSDTKPYSLERVTNAVARALQYNNTVVTGCAITQIADSALAMAVTIGSGGVAKIVASFFVSTVASVFIDAAASAILGFLVPTIAQTLFSNIFDTTVGIPAGELFTKGAAAANTRVGRSGSGQSPSSGKAVQAYNQATNTVLAMDAEIDRKNLSPFDTSNKNTFFGSIAYSLLPIITFNNTTTVASFMRTLSSSLTSLGGHVSASGTNSSYMTTNGDCPALREIGAVGDMYCNPVTTTDLSTIDIDPGDATYANVLMSAGNDNSIPNLTCDDDGNCTINDNSNLARYVSFCAGRNSPFGVLDAGILDSLTITFAGVLNTINNLPIIGDVINIINSILELSPMNKGWATGANCVNSSENPYWDSEMKYYQRYIEDQRILTQMGNYEDSKNPVTAYEEKYEAEHPLDTSLTGIIAHYTGMTKGDAEYMLAFIEYYNFVDQYDPTLRIAMDGDTSESQSGEQVVASIQDRILRFDDSNIDTPLYADTSKYIAYVDYSDLRNRSYAA